MVIYGWNKKGWLVQNSWGDDWGRAGRGVIPYDFKITEAWGGVDTSINSRPDLIKPFSTQLGDAIAKVINTVVNWFVKP